MEKEHTQLIADIEFLLKEAKDYEFHDFNNEKYPAPKKALMDIVEKIRYNILAGKYDN